MDERPLYVALDEVVAKRDPTTRERIFAIPDEPGLAHVLDVNGTHEGDPWQVRGSRTRRLATPEPHFYGARGPAAPCGAMVRVLLPMIFNPENADVCPVCAERVLDGRAFRRDPGSEWFPCNEVLRAEGEAFGCSLREHHTGLHRDTVNGVMWDSEGLR